MLESARVRTSAGILEALRANPYLKSNDAATLKTLLRGDKTAEAPAVAAVESAVPEATASGPEASSEPASASSEEEGGASEEHISAYLAEHATEIVAEEGKPFQPIGGIMDLLGADYFPVSAVQDVATNRQKVSVPAARDTAAAAAAKPAVRAVAHAPAAPKRENTMQKINGLDVKGRIQLALKGNKEERSILIRDGTKVVALAVLEAPKLSDGEVEKFALQKNVLEAVLRQIPLKRRFMKNYIVVRNLVSNPRTPLDLGLGLMKHLLAVDLKNISANKEVSETVRKLALKMYKQKLETANKK